MPIMFGVSETLEAMVCPVKQCNHARCTHTPSLPPPRGTRHARTGTATLHGRATATTDADDDVTVPTARERPVVPPRARASRNGLQAMNGYCGGLNSRGRTDGGIDGGDGCGRRSVRRRLHPGTRPAARLPVKLWPRWHAKSGRGSNGSRIQHGRNCPSHMTNESAYESGEMLHTQTLDE